MSGRAAGTGTRAADVLAHVRRVQRPVSSGVVAFRFDDAPLTDLPFAQLLRSYGIPVELAVPAAFIDRPRRLRLGQLRRLVSAGHTVANHSHAHGRPPATTEELVAEIARAEEAFRGYGLAALSFVQPGPWSAGGPGSLDSAEGARSVDAELGGRFVCLEGYGGDPYQPVPTPEDVRFGLPHVTLDSMPWREIVRCVERIVSERRFVQFVVHTSRSLRSPGARLLPWRLWRLARWCARLEARGLLACRSVIGAVAAAGAEGVNLVDETPAEIREDRQTWRFREPLLAGLSYRLTLRATHGAARGEAWLQDASTGQRVSLRRSGASADGLFGIVAPRDWELVLFGTGAAPVVPAVHAV